MAALAPAPFGLTALLERAQAAVAKLTATTKAVAVGAGTAAVGAVCVVTGVVPAPFAGQGGEAPPPPAIERGIERPVAPTDSGAEQKSPFELRPGAKESSDRRAPAENESPDSEPSLKPTSPPAPEGAAIPASAPPPEPAPAPAPVAPTTGSGAAAGEFGP